MRDGACGFIGIANIPLFAQRIFAVLEAIAIIVNIVIADFFETMSFVGAERVIAVPEPIAVVIVMIMAILRLAVQRIGRTNRILAVLFSIIIIIDSVITNLDLTMGIIVACGIFAVLQTILIVVDIVITGFFLAHWSIGACGIFAVDQTIFVIVDVIVTFFWCTYRQMEAPGVFAVGTAIVGIVFLVITVGFWGIRGKIGYNAADKIIIMLTDDRIAIQGSFTASITAHMAMDSGDIRDIISREIGRTT